MSGRARQTRALCVVVFNQRQDLGLKCILRAVNGSNRLSERLLLELVLNRQAEFSEFFDVGPRMKLQFFKFREDYKGLLQLCRFCWLSRLCNFRFGSAFG